MVFIGTKTRTWNKQTAADGELIDAEVNQIYADLNDLQSNKANNADMAAALLFKLNTSEKGSANGLAVLDALGKLVMSQIADSSITQAMLAGNIKPTRPYSLLFTPEDITLSAVDPYFDISSLDQTITAAQFPELAPKMRAKKARVNISGTKYNSFNVGATYTANGSSVVLQLANNAQNISLLTAMAEAKAYFNTGLSLGVIHLDVPVGNIPVGDYGITDVDSAGLTITFASTAAVGTPSGSETIAIYPHRIAGNATDAKHYMLSEIGFMLHGGVIADGYPVRDQTQGHWHATYAEATDRQYNNTVASPGNWPSGTNNTRNTVGEYVKESISDNINGTPRVGSKTRGPALGINVYYYCGTYNP